MILSKIFRKIYEIFHPYKKLDEALRNSLKDSFANSPLFSLKEIRYTKKGFILDLDYNKEGIGKSYEESRERKSFLDYLPSEYSSYKNIYESFTDSVKRIEERMKRRFEDLEGRLNQHNLQFSFGGLNE
jgi:hypothetical protein